MLLTSHTLVCPFALLPAPSITRIELAANVSVASSAKFHDLTDNSVPAFPPIHKLCPSCDTAIVLAVLFDGLTVHLADELDSPVSSSYPKALTSPVRRAVNNTGSEGWKAKSKGCAVCQLGTFERLSELT